MTSSTRREWFWKLDSRGADCAVLTKLFPCPYHDASQVRLWMWYSVEYHDGKHYQTRCNEYCIGCSRPAALSSRSNSRGRKPRLAPSQER